MTSSHKAHTHISPLARKPWHQLWLFWRKRAQMWAIFAQIQSSQLISHSSPHESSNSWFMFFSPVTSAACNIMTIAAPDSTVLVILCHFFLTPWCCFYAELSARAEEEGKPASSMCSVVGEGGEGGDILAGKSLVFACLEVCLCVLVRHIPALNPSLPPASTQGLLQPPRLNESTTQLVCSAISILADLPPLCSPAGKDRRRGFHKKT